ncbi:MAG TPA: folate-binding protein [Roseiarcus sp.]|nr:folate-binding protein [Roseiarcus sp.]
MTETAVFLKDRGVARVAGADAASFLQGLITNDVEKLPEGGVRYAALLSPQGKILFDFLVFRKDPETFLIDAPADRIAELVKRLAMYRLRARIEIADVSAQFAAVAGGEGGPADPRHPGLGRRALVPRAEAPPETAQARADYEARRVAAGAPQGGLDFAYGDVFPQDANMDLLNGVDFAKGCYVGQEVVSRMKHRGAVRKRIARLALDGPAPASGEAVVDGALPVGVLGTVAGDQALAMLRIDRAQEAESAGRALTAAGVPVRRLQ